MLESEKGEGEYQDMQRDPERGRLMKALSDREASVPGHRYGRRLEARKKTEPVKRPPPNCDRR